MSTPCQALLSCQIDFRVPGNCGEEENVLKSLAFSLPAVVPFHMHVKSIGEDQQSCPHSVQKLAWGLKIYHPNGNHSELLNAGEGQHSYAPSAQKHAKNVSLCITCVKGRIIPRTFVTLHVITTKWCMSSSSSSLTRSVSSHVKGLENPNSDAKPPPQEVAYTQKRECNYYV